MTPRARYVLVDRRRSRNESSGRGVGTVAAVGGFGLLLYLLLKNLGIGSGDGGGIGGHGEPPGPTPPVTPPKEPPPLPPIPPIPPPKTPPRPPDKQAVAIVVRPSPTDPMRAIIVLEGRDVSVGELIARIDAGGRRDVLVTVTGDTVQGAWDEIRDALQFAGIQVFNRLKPGTHVSGNARGQYTRWSAS